MLDLTSHVRLGLALAHSWPGGAITLHAGPGRALRAAAGRVDADLTPCELRTALLAQACPLWTGLTARVTDVHVEGGGVVDLGGGLYARTGADGPHTAERWFATFLAPATVHRVLDECPLAMAEQLGASLRPDPDLGVVVIVLSTTNVAMHATLDDAARWASAACFTQELLHSLQPRHSTP